MGQVLTIEFDRLREAFTQRRHGPPLEEPGDPARIGIETPDVDRFPVGRPLRETEAAGARDSNEKLREVAVRDRFGASEIERLAVAGI